jgi:hypothetical protein
MNLDDPQYHSYRFPSSMLIDFQLNNSDYEDNESQNKVKAHGELHYICVCLEK